MAWERSDANLPRAATAAVDLFSAELQASLGDRLRCLALYGSAVQGGYRPRQSDLNLLVIVSELQPGDLSAVGRAAARAGEQVAPVVLAEPELPELAVLAPATWWDVIEQHHLVAGDESCLAPLPELPDLARQLRFELRDKLHRLRAAYLAQAARPAQLEATARRSFGSVLHLLRGALRLYGRDARLHPVQALGEVARTLQLNLDLLRRLFTLRYEDEPLGRGRIDGVFGDYLDLIETAGDRLAELTLPTDVEAAETQADEAPPAEPAPADESAEEAEPAEAPATEEAPAAVESDEVAEPVEAEPEPVVAEAEAPAAAESDEVAEPVDVEPEPVVAEAAAEAESVPDGEPA